ncbi:MAG: hypothetical protein U1E38_05595 [Rhodospirillales bacterium]
MNKLVSITLAPGFAKAMDSVQHLTPDLRARFERLGEAAVEWHVANPSTYPPQEPEHYAALVWLGEKQAERERLERLTFWVVVATLVFTVMSLMATVWFGLR